MGKAVWSFLPPPHTPPRLPPTPSASFTRCEASCLRSVCNWLSAAPHGLGRACGDTPSPAFFLSLLPS